MAIFFDAPVAPDALTAFVREVPTPGENVLSALFPTRFFDTNTVDFSEIVRTNRTARFRSYDGRIHVSDRDTGSDKRVGLPPLSDSRNMGEYERLQLEFARTGGTNTAALANAVYNDAEHLTMNVLNRIELAWGDLLTDGKLTMMGPTGDEPSLEADYSVPGTHIVSAGTPWTTVASANVLNDLIAWVDVYIATNGTAPAWILTSNRIRRLLQTNAQLIGAIEGTTSGRTRVTAPQINDLFSSEGLPQLLPDPYDRRLDVDGVSTRVLGDDKVILLPQNIADLGFMAYGLSATALELVNSNVADMSFENAPGIVGVVEKVGPPYRQFTYVDAVGMPILANSSLLFVADVAA